MAEREPSAEHSWAARQGCTRRVLHLHMHQLAADVALREPLGCGVWASGLADHRCPHTRVRVRTHPSECGDRNPRAGRAPSHRSGQRVSNLGRMGQSGLAFVLSFGQGRTGAACPRGRGSCPGDRGRHSQPAGPCARRRERTSGRRRRPVPHWHPRDVFRFPSSHAAGSRTVAPGRRGSLRLHAAPQSRIE